MNLNTTTLLATCLLWLVHGNAVCADGQSEPAKPAAIAVPLDPPPPLPTPESSDATVRTDAVAAVAIDHPDGLPVYTPPRRGAPKTRVGGGTRSLSTGTHAGEVLTVLRRRRSGRRSRPNRRCTGSYRSRMSVRSNSC